MKVCQKCETKVANNAKICKNCGADVTKAEIIKTEKKQTKTASKKTTSSKANTTKNAPKKTSNTKKQTVQKSKKQTKAKTSSSKNTASKKTTSSKVKTTSKKTTTKKATTPKKETISKTTTKKTTPRKSNTEKAPKVEIIKNQNINLEEPKLIKVKSSILKRSKTICYYTKKSIVYIGIKLYEILKIIYNFLKSEVVFYTKAFIEIINLLYRYLKVLALFISKIALTIVAFIKDEIIICTKATIISIFEGFKSTGKMIASIPKKLKALLKSIAKSINNKHIKRQERKINKQYAKYERYQEQLQIIEQNIEEKIEPKHRKKNKLKIAVTSIIVLIILIGSAVYVKSLYEELLGKPINIAPTHKALKATTEKVFSMDDVISYKDVDYQIVKVETSNGNAYKTPKPGNQFLIVTIYIKNNSKEKKNYSYENWTMSNSKKEEKKRIFTSINVDTALYSGELVRGGIKTGSMVFEQPTNDPKLKINFYELKKDEDGNEIADESKRVFSISIKNPTPAAEQEKQKEDLKIVKTNEKTTS